MLRLLHYTIFVFVIPTVLPVTAQDTSLLPAIDFRYPQQLSNKIALYNHRLSARTEKTLVRLSRWENKIQKKIYNASPETAQRVFGNNRLTFARLLEQMREGILKTEHFQNAYDGYVDSLTNITKYLSQHKEQLDEKVNLNTEEVLSLAETLDNTRKQTEYIKSFIKERKRLLLSETTKYIGNSRSLRKINQKSYYYAETLKNYQELFSNETRREEFVRKTLNQIPAFQKFMREHSELATLFAMPGSGMPDNSMTSLAGLQTRASVQNIIQSRIAAGGADIFAGTALEGTPYTEGWGVDGFGNDTWGGGGGGGGGKAGNGTNQDYTTAWEEIIGGLNSGRGDTWSPSYGFYDGSLYPDGLNWVRMNEVVVQGRNKNNFSYLDNNDFFFQDPYIIRNGERIPLASFNKGTERFKNGYSSQATLLLNDENLKTYLNKKRHQFDKLNQPFYGIGLGIISSIKLNAFTGLILTTWQGLQSLSMSNASALYNEVLISYLQQGNRDGLYLILNETQVTPGVGAAITISSYDVQFYFPQRKLFKEIHYSFH